MEQLAYLQRNVRYVKPYDSREKHFPGMNYCGPGTNVWRRIKNGVEPVDALDHAAFKHDLDTEPRGPYNSKGVRRKLRAADRLLQRRAEQLLKEGYQPAWKAIAVAEGMKWMLITGARGR